MTDANRPTYHYSPGGWMNDVIPYADGQRPHVHFNHHKEPRFGRFRWGHDDRGRGGVELTVDWAAGTVAGYGVGPLPAREPVTLRTFVDASVVEAFVLGRLVTLRGYDLPAARRVAVRGPAHVTTWRLAPPPGAHNVGTPGVVTAERA